MKKALIISLLIGLLPFTMMAQVSVPVQKGEKWGIQRNNEWILKPKYFSMTAFGSSFIAQIKKHEKKWKQEWMLFSQNGDPLLSNNCFSIEIIHPDRAIVNERQLIDSNGKIIFDAIELKTTSIKDLSYSPLLNYSSRDKYGLIDYNGNIVFSTESWNGFNNFVATNIPGVIKQGTRDGDRYISLLTGEMYTFPREGKISDIGNDIYRISSTTEHYNSGKRLIPGTAHQYIVTGSPSRWTTTTNCYYYNGKFYKEKPEIESAQPHSNYASNKKESGRSTDTSSSQLAKSTINSKLLPNLIIVPNSILFVDPSGQNSVRANSNYLIRLKVRNIGKGRGEKCTATVKMKGNSTGISAKTVQLGSIPAGATNDVEIPIESGMNTQEGQVEFAIQVNEQNGFGTDPQLLLVNTRAFVAPLVKVTDYSLTSNEEQTLRKKIPFDLQILLQNIKQGTAENVNVSLILPDNVYKVEGKDNTFYKQLIAGETHSLVYSLVVSNNYASTQIPIQVKIKEKHGKYSENCTINLKLDQAIANSKISVEESKREHKDITIASIGSDVDKNIPNTTIHQNNTFAVIITNENYEMVSHVEYANNDGKIFAAYCKETLGIPEKNIRIHQNATYGKMLDAVNDIKSIAQAFAGNINIILYYAGHGLPNEQSREAYLLPIDADGKRTDVCYPVNRLYKELGSLGANSILVFMDACFSGTQRGDGMLASTRGVALKAKAETPQGNMVVFSAASGDETAYPYKEKGHGLFTYFLLKKLQESKGNCTLGELGEYIQTNVCQQSVVVNRKSQTPTVVPSANIANDWKNLKLR